MKSYQFFKICKRFYKKKEKTLVQQSMKKRTEKSWTLFYNSYFIKSFKITVNHFFFNRSFCAQGFFYFASLFAAKFSLFDIRITQEIPEGVYIYTPEGV